MRPLSLTAGLILCTAWCWIAWHHRHPHTIQDYERIIIVGICAIVLTAHRLGYPT